MAASPRAMALNLDPSTVASLLEDSRSRIATLTALETHRGPHPTGLAIAAAPALTELMCRDAEEVGQALFQRVGLLRARLLVDAVPDDVPAIYGAIIGGGRLAAYHGALSNVIAQLFAKPTAELDLTDALTYACGDAPLYPPMSVRGWTAPFAAAGFKNTLEPVGIILTGDHIHSK